MAIVKGILGNVFLANGAAAPFTDEAMTANVAKTVFTIDDEDKRFWSPADALTVKYDGSAVTDYASVQRPGGIVTWAETPGDSAVTVSGKYIPVAALGTVRSWQMERSPQFVDVTCLQDEAKTQEPIYSETSISIERFYVDEALWEDVTTDFALVGLDLFVWYDASTPANCLRYTGMGYVSSHAISANVEGMVEEPVSFAVTEGPYFVAGLA